MDKIFKKWMRDSFINSLMVIELTQAKHDKLLRFAKMKESLSKERIELLKKIEKEERLALKMKEKAARELKKRIKILREKEALERQLREQNEEKKRRKQAER